MSCSISVDPDGPSQARCFSWNCDYRGSFFRLIQTAVRARPDAAAFDDLLKWIAENDKDDIEARARQMNDAIASRLEDGASVKVQPKPIREHNRDVLDDSHLDEFKGSVPRYALDRGLDIDAAKAWELGYDQTRGRLIFPVRRHDGPLVGMTGRILPSAQAAAEARGREVTKYHNYSGLNKTRYLYGAHLWDTGKPIVIVEGPLDALRTWMALKGRVNVGATLGQGFSQEHRQLVRIARPSHVYIFADGDAAGQRMAEKVFDRLQSFVELKVMLTAVRFEVDPNTNEDIEVVTDPGEMTDEEIVKAFEDAESLLGQTEWRV
jgi:5S rRNA maturation endonuclease (ribonuclease M5)